MLNPKRETSLAFLLAKRMAVQQVGKGLSQHMISGEYRKEEHVEKLLLA